MGETAHAINIRQISGHHAAVLKHQTRLRISGSWFLLVWLAPATAGKGRDLGHSLDGDRR